MRNNWVNRTLDRLGAFLRSTGKVESPYASQLDRDLSLMDAYTENTLLRAELEKTRRQANQLKEARDAAVKALSTAIERGNELEAELEDARGREDWMQQQYVSVDRRFTEYPEKESGENPKSIVLERRPDQVLRIVFRDPDVDEEESVSWM